MRTIRRKNSHGFTLVELLIAVIVLSFVLAATAALLNAGMKARDQVTDSTSLQEQAQAAADAMATEVLGASRVMSATSTNLQLKRSDGTLVEFVLTNGTLTRNDPDGTSVDLANNVGSLSFALRDKLGNLIATPGDPTAAAGAGRVEITLSLTSPEGSGASVHTIAKLRNRF